MRMSRRPRSRQHTSITASSAEEQTADSLVSLLSPSNSKTPSQSTVCWSDAFYNKSKKSDDNPHCGAPPFSHALTDCVGLLGAFTLAIYRHSHLYAALARNPGGPQRLSCVTTGCLPFYM